MGDSDILVEVKDLKTWFGSHTDPIRAVDGASFVIPEGKTVALVGESGCGKSITALSLARLVPQPPGFYAGGQVLFKGNDVLAMSERELCKLRGNDIAYVFQEPTSSLNPVFTVGNQIMESIKLHRNDVDVREEAISLMTLVGLAEPERRLNAYPHEMSGGMQQRIMIAMALACRPRLLVADEPTTALDVTIQAQILELLKDLQNKLGMAVLLITHNLGLVADVSHYTNVMYAGRIVEYGETESVLTHPMHPYTRGLLNAVPKLALDSENLTDDAPKRLQGIPGTVPNPMRLPVGCKFAARCNKVQEKCLQSEPTSSYSSASNDESKFADRMVRCYFPDK